MTLLIVKFIIFDVLLRKKDIANEADIPLIIVGSLMSGILKKNHTINER